MEEGKENNKNPHYLEERNKSLFFNNDFYQNNKDKQQNQEGGVKGEKTLQQQQWLEKGDPTQNVDLETATAVEEKAEIPPEVIENITEITGLSDNKFINELLFNSILQITKEENEIGSSFTFIKNMEQMEPESKKVCYIEILHRFSNILLSSSIKVYGFSFGLSNPLFLNIAICVFLLLYNFDFFFVKI